MFRIPRLIPAALLVATSTIAFAQTAPLDNDAVLKLQKAGLTEDLIVTTVTNSPGHYDLATDKLIALKQAGLTDKEIGAMIAKNANPNGTPTTTVVVAAAGPQLPAGVDEVGVYYKGKDGKWVEFAPEIVNYKSGGALKSFASQGLVKMDKNGHINGKSAPTTLTRPVEFLLYTPEGTAPNEYVLLKLRENSNNREFRSETGGVVHTSSGASRDAQEFTPSKIGPRLYTFSLGPETKPGEYGILPPGSYTSTNAASGGKIDTFHLAE